jgi:hypothetical protein
MLAKNLHIGALEILALVIGLRLWVRFFRHLKKTTTYPLALQSIQVKCDINLFRHALEKSVIWQL